MASFSPSITDAQTALLSGAPLFFVATTSPGAPATADGPGPLNLSPKGGVRLHVLGPNRVAYLDYAGSGNETAEHLNAGGPITVMACSLSEDAAIVRLYGRGRAVPIEGSDLQEHIADDERVYPGKAHQVIEVDVERTMTSCGYGVPIMEVTRQRTAKDRGRMFKSSRE